MATHLARRGSQTGVRERAPRQWDRIVAHRGWLEARDRAIAGLARRPALVVVLGDAGSGKTVLMHELLRVLRAGSIPAHLVAAPADPLLSNLDHGPSVRLIDDAGCLEPNVLRGLSQDPTGLTVLAARHEFGPLLCGLSSAATVLELEPLRPSEIVGFLAASLAKTDLSQDVFTDAAISRLAARSGGVPRRLHDLAGTAIFLADREHAGQVDARHVDQAALVGEAGPEAVIGTMPVVADAAIPVVAAPDIADVRVAARGAEARTRLADPAPSPARRWLLPASVTVAAAAALAVMLTGHSVLTPMWPPGPGVSSHASPSTLHPASIQVPTPEPAPDPAPVPASSRPAPVLQAPVLQASVTQTPDPPRPIPPQPVPQDPPPQATIVPPQVQANLSPPEAPPGPPPEQAVPEKPVADRAVLEKAIPEQVVTPLPLLPSGALVEVSLRFPPGNALAARRAATLAADLRKDGFSVSEPRALPSRLPEGTRYVFAEDHDAAAEIAEAAHRHAADLPQAARRETPGERDPAPRPGSVDIIVSGEGEGP